MFLDVASTPPWKGGEFLRLKVGRIDLGDRIIDVIPIPGHDVLSLAYYDRQTGILLTGDGLYPGR